MIPSTRRQASMLASPNHIWLRLHRRFSLSFSHISFLQNPLRWRGHWLRFAFSMQSRCAKVNVGAPGCASSPAGDFGFVPHFRRAGNAHPTHAPRQHLAAITSALLRLHPSLATFRIFNAKHVAPCCMRMHGAAPGRTGVCTASFLTFQRAPDRSVLNDSPARPQRCCSYNPSELRAPNTARATFPAGALRMQRIFSNGGCAPRVIFAQLAGICAAPVPSISYFPFSFQKGEVNDMRPRHLLRIGIESA